MFSFLHVIYVVLVIFIVLLFPFTTRSGVSFIASLYIDPSSMFVLFVSIIICVFSSKLIPVMFEFFASSDTISVVL